MAGPVRAGPNTALEATGHSGRFLAGVGLYLWPAPQLGRYANEWTLPPR